MKRYFILIIWGLITLNTSCKKEIKILKLPEFPKLLKFFKSSKLDREVFFEKRIPDPLHDEAYSALEANGGGYLVGGWSEISKGDHNVRVLKLDKDFNVLWERELGGVKNDAIFRLIELKDGSVVGVGYTYSYSRGLSDIYVFKINKRGILEWEITHGGPERDEAFCCCETEDGGILITGWTRSYGEGEFDIFLLKLTKDGQKEYFKTIGGVGNDAALSIKRCNDGNYIIAGYTNSRGNGGNDVLVMKVTKDGDLLWSRAYGGPKDDEGLCVTEGINGGYIVVGRTKSYGNGEQDVYVIKIDQNGYLDWSKSFGGEDDDRGFCIIRDMDEGYVIAGSTRSFGEGNSDIYLLKVSEVGELLWQTTFGGEGVDEAYQVSLCKDGTYLVSGWSKSFETGFDYYLVKTSERYCASKGIKESFKVLGADFKIVPKLTGQYFEIKTASKKDELVEIEADIITLKNLDNREFERKFNSGFLKFQKEKISSVVSISKENLECGFHSPCTYYFKVEPRFEGERLLSFMFHLEEFTGGAHGSHVVGGITLDLESGRQLTLFDIVDRSLESKIKQLILKEVRSNREKYEAGADNYILEDDLGERHFYVVEGGIVIIYQEYEIACYAEGEQVFYIPWYQLGIRKPSIVR